MVHPERAELAAKIERELAEFHEYEWPVYRERGFTFAAAVQACQLLQMTGLLIELREEVERLSHETGEEPKPPEMFDPDRWKKPRPE